MSLVIYKILGTFFTFGLAAIFGLLPIVSKVFNSNQKLLSYANCFAGGLFLSIGLLHLLPEAHDLVTEGLEHNHNHDHNIGHGDHGNFPWAFLAAILSFILVLIVDKILFTKEENADDEAIKKKMSLKRSVLSKNASIENENLKMSLSSKYKIGLRLSNIGNSKNELNENLNNNHDHNHHDGHHHHHPTVTKKTSTLLSYVLFLAIGFHSVFEGLALGLTSTTQSYLSILISILVHKWAESLTIGVSLVTAEVSKKKSFFLMVFYASISPIGIVIGHVSLSSNNKVFEGILYAISAGTFLYISAVEIITEEFSTFKNKWIKLLLFLFGFSINVIVTSL